jgi:hypothetical protein
MNTQHLYAVTTIFNPLNFRSRYRLYRDFAARMAAAAVPLITVEVAFFGRPFVVTDKANPMHVQIRSGHLLWHKERALNVGFRHLIQNINVDAAKIAWIDADVSFSRPDWAMATIDALDHYAVVQPFGQAINLDRHGHSQWHCSSAFANFDGRGYHQDPPMPVQYWEGGHPGLAWAARRETLEQLGGLLDFCIAGSGDTHMANGLMGKPHSGVARNHANNTLKGLSGGFTERLLAWAGRCDLFVKGNVGFVPGACLHHWHGESEKRGYFKRFDIMRFHQFDPNTDLITELSGLYGYAGNKPRMEQDIRRSMSERNEDA